MSTGDSEKTTIATDSEKFDVVQGFIEENRLDEQRVEPYKGYKKYGDWADTWLGPITIGLLVVALIATAILSWLDLPYTDRVTGILVLSSFAVLGVLFLLAIVSSIARWFSEITAEQVAYHELASAFQAYRQDDDNVKPVFDRVSTALEFFDERYFKRLDQKRHSDIERYLKKIAEVDDPDYIEEEFNSTFPQFMEVFSGAIMTSSNSVFADLAKDMDSAYTGERPMVTRLIIDLKRGARFLLTGPELVISIATIALIASYFQFDLTFGSALGIFGGIIAVYTLHQNRE